MGDPVLAEVELSCGCQLFITKTTYGYGRFCRRKRHQAANIHTLLKTARLKLVD